MASSSGILPFMAIKNYYRCACCVLRPTHMKRYRKLGDRKRATCLATLLQNKLNSDVTRFTTHIKPVLQQIRLLTGLNVSGKTRNIAIQLVLQQCCKTSCTFLLPVFPYLKGLGAVCSHPTNTYFKKCSLEGLSNALFAVFSLDPLYIPLESYYEWMVIH